MFSTRCLKQTAFIVATAYLSALNASAAFAADSRYSIRPELFAQADANDASANAEEQQLRKALYEERIRQIEQDISRAKGIRKNIFMISIGTLAAGGTVNLAVNTINNAIDDIPSSNPEAQSPTDPIEIRIDNCTRYQCTANDADDAKTSMDGIKGIGGWIFLAGAAGLATSLFYTPVIHGKQKQIDALRTELYGTSDSGNTLTPEFLQRNETAAAISDEINALKKGAGKNRTTSDVFTTAAITGILSGFILVGVSNASSDIVDDITVDKSNADEVNAKSDALDKADGLENIGWGLVGAGALSGVTSYVFYRSARGKEKKVNELENSLLQIADHLRILPRSDGVMAMYSVRF